MSERAAEEACASQDCFAAVISFDVVSRREMPFLACNFKGYHFVERIMKNEIDVSGK